MQDLRHEVREVFSSGSMVDARIKVSGHPQWDLRWCNPRMVEHSKLIRPSSIGWWVAAFSAGSAAGPVLGGVRLERFWWGSVFLLALPVMAALLILGPRVLPEYRDSNAGRFDLVSAGLSLGAVLAVIFALKEVTQNGIGPVPVWTVLLGLLLDDQHSLPAVPNLADTDYR